ncbi:AAA family ATPase [Streptomyces sp. SD31]|uniref:AAA family ATPase n=1 Tax=Streptomyces sp. SD31 TaxID=3452208 RepID=UPI003F8B3897
MKIRLLATRRAATIAGLITAETPDCLIVTGMPGAGKSTVTRLVAERLPRSARLDGDFINRLVVSGHVWALGEPADEAARQVELCNRNLCTLANNSSDAGFTPVIDWVIPDHRQLDFFVSLLPAQTGRARALRRTPAGRTSGRSGARLRRLRRVTALRTGSAMRRTSSIAPRVTCRM